MKNFIIAIASVAALGLAEAAKEPLEVITRILGVKWSTISGTGGQLARNMQRTKSNSLRGKPSCGPRLFRPAARAAHRLRR